MTRNSRMNEIINGIEQGTKVELAEVVIAVSELPADKIDCDLERALCEMEIKAKVRLDHAKNGG